MTNQLVASFIIGAAAFWGAFQLYPLVFPPASVKAASVSLEKTIQSIKHELLEIGATPGETAGLVLGSVKVELSAQRQDENNAAAKLAIPVFEEAGLSAEIANKLTRGSKMTLVFNAPSGEQLLAQTKSGDLDLSALVLAARQALLATAAQKPVLPPKSVDIEVNFVFVRSEKSSAGVKAHVIDVGGTSAQVDTVGNKVVLSYINPLFQSQKDNKSGAPIPPK